MILNTDFLVNLYVQAEAKILRGPHEDLESYLEAIDQLRRNVNFFTNNKIFKSCDGVLNHANNLLAKAISKLEDEFRQILTNYRFVSFATVHIDEFLIVSHEADTVSVLYL